MELEKKRQCEGTQAAWPAEAFVTYSGTGQTQTLLQLAVNRCGVFEASSEDTMKLQRFTTCRDERVPSDRQQGYIYITLTDHHWL